LPEHVARNLDARSLHRRLVPVVAMPLLLTVLSGIGLSRFPSATLYALHTGDFGRLDLTGSYTAVLGICLLILMISGLSLWWRRP
jgi:hypothetical protein